MKPKVGIALSGGAVRGISHIGILKVLERENIPINFIAGTSIGALIGALYACGIKINEIEQMAKTAKWKELVDFTIPKDGLIAGKKIENYIKNILPNKNFEELSIPLSIIATDLNSGEKVIFDRGNVINAIRASISVPGVFEPLIDNNSIFVDGSLVDPIPVDIVKSMGSEIVIAVDLTIDMNQIYLSGIKKEESEFTRFFEREFISTEISYLKDFLKENKIKLPFLVRGLLSTRTIMNILTSKEVKIVKYTIRSLDILSNQFAKEKLKYPYIDVIIKPEFHGIEWTEFDKTEECIKSGEIAAEEVIPKINRLLNKEVLIPKCD